MSCSYKNMNKLSSDTEVLSRFLTRVVDCHVCPLGEVCEPVGCREAWGYALTGSDSEFEDALWKSIGG